MPPRPCVAAAGRRTPWDVAVVVPARDEVELLPRCLASIVAAAGSVPAPGRTHIVVVADRCVDDTEAAAAAALASANASILRARCTSVGSVRQLGVDAALRMWPPDPTRRVWIAMTDADSVVPPDWLAYQLRAAARGWDAVAGAVTVSDWEDRSRRTSEALVAYRRDQRRAGTWSVHGANLGVRADVLAAVGGIPAVVHSEDAGTVALLERSSRAVLRTSELVVTTSARRSWRAPGGFSTLLDQFGAAAGLMSGPAERLDDEAILDVPQHAPKRPVTP
ncbi:MAG TPA: glycosyltransferase family 2 protein [Euzebyales bacterium]|nr:glycosyltransferase family 2 protein [Euzebyales bacterium]